MNDASPRQEIPEIPDAVEAPKRRCSIQLVWILPIIAAIIGGTIAVNAYLGRGYQITITFDTGTGLEAGKTRIKYKDVVIGKVEKIEIAQDHSHVIVTARLGKKNKEFLAKDTRYWVVRPRISGGYISGLDTLMGGTYIGVDAGKAKETSQTFRGLEIPPVVTSGETGTKFFLHASDLGSLNITSPIYFHRFQVGQVAGFDLDMDGKGVIFTIFIKSPYDRLIRENSLFWHASGIDLSFNTSGFKIKTQSLISILLGGIAFDNPNPNKVGPRAPPNSIFTLFADKEDATNHAQTTQAFRLICRESVRGLSVQSKVEFHGVPLGEVTAINLAFDHKLEQFYVAVDIRLFLERLVEPMLSGAQKTENPRSALDDLVHRGLRARLGRANLLTGRRAIDLDFIDKTEPAKINWQKMPPVFPSTLSGQDDLQLTLEKIAHKIDKMPLNELADELRRSISSLNQSLANADKLLSTVNKEIAPGVRLVLKDAHDTLGAAQKVLSEDSPMQNDLRDALRQLSRAAWSVRNLVDYLQRDPESLIRGKKEGKQ
jgi:paraquat-inducible protein B